MSLRYTLIYQLERIFQINQLGSCPLDLFVLVHILKYNFRWEALAYSSVRFTVPDDWKAGRIWVRIMHTL